MPSVAVVLEYVGTAYRGYQVQEKQAGGLTIQGEVERALFSLTGERIRIVGAGRTDAGVHALGQVVSFATASTIPPDRFAPALNTKLPPDIRAIRSFEVRSGFNARFDAVSKVYRYLVACGGGDDGRDGRGGRGGDVARVAGAKPGAAILAGRALVLDEPLPDGALEAMRTAAAALVGTHDFAAFATAGSSARTTVRTVSRLEVKRETWPALGQEIMVFEVQADGFLYKMVRTIVAALLEVGAGRREASWPAELLVGRDRTEGPATAPPDGLYLVRVDYPEPYTALARP